MARWVVTHSSGLTTYGPFSESRAEEVAKQLQEGCWQGEDSWEAVEIGRLPGETPPPPEPIVPSDEEERRLYEVLERRQPPPEAAALPFDGSEAPIEPRYGVRVSDDPQSLS